MYTTYYGVCVDDIDPHYEPGCDYVPEKARIRRGAWVHESVVAAILVDPITAATWNTAITAGKVVIMPELSGNFDGGTPVMGPGFGDAKEIYIGSNFKANIKDRVYKENWAHYRSMLGKTTWHFAYLTESLVHITDKPVTVAPKNPITDNIDDSVIWEADITWFQFFTPAPHVAPLTVFMPA